MTFSTLFLQVRMEGVMGEIQAKDPDSFGSANFDVINLRENGPYKVLMSTCYLSPKYSVYLRQTPFNPSSCELALKHSLIYPSFGLITCVLCMPIPVSFGHRSLSPSRYKIRRF